MSRSPIFVAIDTPDLDQGADPRQGGQAPCRRAQARPRILLRQRPRGRARDGRARPADLPRPEAARHPQHRRQGDPGAARVEPAILTVHAAGGRAMMEDAKAAAPAGTKVVGVTVLTSLDERDLEATGVRGDPHDQVERLAELARDAGLDGIVCSGGEVKAAHAAWPEGFFVVPGVRPADGNHRRPETRRSPRARRWIRAPRSSSSAARSAPPRIPTRRSGRSQRRCDKWTSNAAWAYRRSDETSRQK